MSEEMEFGPDILTLVDEEGTEHAFEVVDSLEQGDQRYVALVPVLDEEDALEDSGELVVLKSVEVDGEEFLEAIEDEAEFDEIAAIFMERLQDEFDFEEE